ncbi:MAG: hypothetical protein AB7I13_10475 [Vicinamibacterales bacterium]
MRDNIIKIVLAVVALAAIGVGGFLLDVWSKSIAIERGIRNAREPIVCPRCGQELPR